MTPTWRVAVVVTSCLLAGVLAAPGAYADPPVGGDGTPNRAPVSTLEPADAAAGDDTDTDIPLPQGAEQPRPEQPVTRLLVRTTDGRTTTSAVSAAAADLAGVDGASPVRSLGGGTTVLGLSAPVTVEQAWEVTRALTARADIAYAEPDLPLYPTTDSPVTPADPQFPSQWDLWDAGSPTAGGYSSKAPAAWGRTTGSASVVVAVVDTGITGHADLAGQQVPGYDFVSNPVNANDGDGRDANPADPGDWTSAAESANPASGFYGCPTTSSWHGTHVAGVIAAKQGNSLGISGVAPGVRVMPVRALGRCFGYSSDIAAAIEWASGGSVPGVPANANPATVINLSLGGTGVCESAGVLQQAITNARARGATVVAAAGNENRTITATPGNPNSGSVPANCSGVIRVVATGRAGERAGYSNVGTATHPATLAAPGGNGTSGIVSTVDVGTQAPVGDGYATYQGTSMAAPHVSAAAALIQSLVSPRLGPDEIAARLRASATAFPAGSGCSVLTCGTGILDISAALPTGPGAPPEVEAAGSNGAVDLSWEAPASPQVPITGYHVQISPDAGATWLEVIATTAGTATTMRVAAYAGGIVVNDSSYLFRVSAINAVSEGPPTTSGPAVPGLVVVPVRPQPPAATGGIERLDVTWAAPYDGGTPISGFAVRYRIVGSGLWLAAPAPAGGATASTITSWPAAFPAGTYEVQVAALNARGAGLHSPSTRTTVTPLTQVAAVSAATVRPFPDGFQDSTVISVRSNVVAAGAVRILTAAGVAVRSYALAPGTRWAVTWGGAGLRGKRVPDGTYRVQVLLQGRSAAVTQVAFRTIHVASSKASLPAITLSSPTVFPVKDGYRDTVAIRTSATVPATMTWTILSKKRVVWSTTFTRRGVAATTWNGRDRFKRLVPAGSYVLRVTATGGEGRAAVSAATIVVSAKRTRPAAFSVTVAAGAVAQYGFGSGKAPSKSGTTVLLPADSYATFRSTLPASATTYSGLSIQSCGATSTGSTARPLLGWFTGRDDDPRFARARVVLRPGCVRATVPSTALAGGVLRWWVGNDDIGSSNWRVTQFVLAGVRTVLA